MRFAALCNHQTPIWRAVLPQPPGSAQIRTVQPSLVEKSARGMCPKLGLNAPSALALFPANCITERRSPCRDGDADSSGAHSSGANGDDGDDDNNTAARKRTP
jgi:hypothetical protein